MSELLYLHQTFTDFVFSEHIEHMIWYREHLEHIEHLDLEHIQHNIKNI